MEVKKATPVIWCSGSLDPSLYTCTHWGQCSLTWTVNAVKRSNNYFFVSFQRIVHYCHLLWPLYYTSMLYIRGVGNTFPFRCHFNTYTIVRGPYYIFEHLYILYFFMSLSSFVCCCDFNFCFCSAFWKVLHKYILLSLPEFLYHTITILMHLLELLLLGKSCTFSTTQCGVLFSVSKLCCHALMMFLWILMLNLLPIY